MIKNGKTGDDKVCSRRLVQRLGKEPSIKERLNFFKKLEFIPLPFL
jgi:hypothetical protein